MGVSQKSPSSRVLYVELGRILGRGLTGVRPNLAARLRFFSSSAASSTILAPPVPALPDGFVSGACFVSGAWIPKRSRRLLRTSSGTYGGMGVCMSLETVVNDNKSSLWTICSDLFPFVTFAERVPGLAGTGLRGVFAEEEGVEVVAPEALAFGAVAAGALAATPNRAALSMALSCSVNGIPKRAALLLRFSISALSASSLLTVPWDDGVDSVVGVSAVFVVVDDGDEAPVAEVAVAGTDDDDAEDDCLSTVAFSTGAVFADLEAAGATGSEGGGGARSLNEQENSKQLHRQNG